MQSERTIRARQWRRFRKLNYFTQERLAEVLDINVNTVRQIEGAKVQPHAGTLHKFEVLKHKYEGEKQWTSNRWQESPTKPTESTANQ